MGMKRYILLLAAVFGFLLTLPQTADARPYRRYGPRVWLRSRLLRRFIAATPGRIAVIAIARMRYRPYRYYGDPYYYGPAYYRPYGYYGRPGVSVFLRLLSHLNGWFSARYRCSCPSLREQRRQGWLGYKEGLGFSEGCPAPARHASDSSRSDA